MVKSLLTRMAFLFAFLLSMQVIGSDVTPITKDEFRSNCNEELMQILLTHFYKTVFLSITDSLAKHEKAAFLKVINYQIWLSEMEAPCRDWIASLSSSRQEELLHFFKIPDFLLFLEKLAIVESLIKAAFENVGAEYDNERMPEISSDALGNFCKDYETGKNFTDEEVNQPIKMHNSVFFVDKMLREKYPEGVFAYQCVQEKFPELEKMTSNIETAFHNLSLKLQEAFKTINSIRQLKEATLSASTSD